MNISGHKMLRDFWQERTRTSLVVLAIAVGIAGFAAVLSAYAILTRELDQGYLATNPASAILRTDLVDDDLLVAILSNPDVSDAEPRRIVSGRIKAGPMEWRNLTLFVVKDYGNIRVNMLKPQEGAWPPASGEILIERDAFQVARTRIGDTVTVKTTNGKERELRVSGSVHDVGQAQARMENIVYGYISVETLAQLGEQTYLDQVNILVAKNRFDENHIRQVATDVKKVIEGRGHLVRRVDIPKPGKHPHSDLMGALLLAMSSFGIFSLVLSGIIVVNLLTGLMASQVRQIGVMKAIGGTRWQIERIYFGQALLLGLAAIVVALPLGVFGSRALCRYLAVFLNFDINSFFVPLWVYLLVTVVGLAVPLLAAIYPVWKGSGMSVREALVANGLSQNIFGTSAFDRVLAGIGGRFRPFLLALRNSFRRRTRLALTLVTLAAGGLFFMSALNIRASLISALDREFASRKFDVMVVLGTMYPVESIERAIRQTPGVSHAESWIVTKGALPNPGAEPADGHFGENIGSLHADKSLGRTPFSVIALPPETNLLKLDIVEGRGLLPGDTDAIVVNNGLAAKELQMRVGNTVTVLTGSGQVSWRVVGIAREPFSAPSAYVQQSSIADRDPGMANTLRLVLNKTDPASINFVKTSLDRNLEQENVHTLISVSQADSRIGFDEHMLMIYEFLIVMSLIIGVVGGLGLMTTVSLNVLERRREMGVLRAIGASPLVVSLIVVAEGVLIGALSWGLAALAAWPISRVVGALIFKNGVDFTFEPLGLVIWLVVSVFLAAGASFLPAWHASRVTVREALAYE
jgi:putative ABC transport system permease protein